MRSFKHLVRKAKLESLTYKAFLQMRERETRASMARHYRLLTTLETEFPEVMRSNTREQDASQVRAEDQVEIVHLIPVNENERVN